jgi:phosphoglycolate phosphatase
MVAVELIIFDFDGTLVDSKKAIADSVNFTLENIGLTKKSNEEIMTYVGTGVEALIEQSLGKDNMRFFEKALSVFTEHHIKHSADSSRLYPHVEDVLEHYKDKIKVIITNRRYESAAGLLRSLGAYDDFKKIVGGDDLACTKPSSCPLDRIIEEFKIQDKQKAIMVGDMDIDVYTGKNAGVRTCAVTYGIGNREDIIKAKPDYIIDDISELRNIVK